jgi:hypothetical protein
MQQLDKIDMTDSDTLEKPFSDLVISPIDTHWSRILYYDLFSGRTGDSTRIRANSPSVTCRPPTDL